MKIVYNIAATHNSGGMERVLANKANYLARQGHAVTVVTTDQAWRVPYFPFDERIAQVDLAVNYFETQGKGLATKVLAYFWKQRRHKAQLKKLLFDLKADIVISMFDHEVSFLHKIEDGSKKVLEIHFSRYKRLQYGRKGLWGQVDRWRNNNDVNLAKRYERFVVLTEEDRQNWGDVGGMQVIPNAHSFDAGATALLNEKRVVAVGRYDHQKAFEELISVWAMVRKDYPDWSLFIFGDGPEKDRLLKLIADLKLTDVVTLHPPVKDIESEYARSSVLAMTSRYEGLPMALLEGQACGLPLVAYACQCGPRDIIVHGDNGYLIEPGDRADFAEKLKSLMGDETFRKRMGAASKRRSAAFSEENVMKQWLELFEGL